MLDFVKNISPTELAIVALILIVFFGSKVIVGMARATGESLKEIKNIKKNFTEAITDDKPEKEVSS